jgi:hypothetical protein
MCAVHVYCHRTEKSHILKIGDTATVALDGDTTVVLDADAGEDHARYHLFIEKVTPSAGGDRCVLSDLPSELLVCMALGNWAFADRQIRYVFSYAYIQHGLAVVS